MNIKTILFTLVFVPSVMQAIGQNDSLSKNARSIIDLTLLIYSYDSSLVSRQYTSFDSATNVQISRGLDYSLLAGGLHFYTDAYTVTHGKALVYDTTIVNDTIRVGVDTTIIRDTTIVSDTVHISDSTIQSEIRFQGSQNLVMIGKSDSTILIYNRDPAINIIGLPLLDSSFNYVYLRTVTTDSITGISSKMTITLDTTARFKRIEIFYLPSTYDISRIIYYSNEQRRDGFEEVEESIRYTLITDVTISRISSMPALITPDFFSENKYFYKSGEDYLPQSTFTGYKVIPVF